MQLPLKTLRRASTRRPQIRGPKKLSVFVILKDAVTIFLGIKSSGIIPFAALEFAAAAMLSSFLEGNTRWRCCLMAIWALHILKAGLYYKAFILTKIRLNLKPLWQALFMQRILMVSHCCKTGSFCDRRRQQRLRQSVKNSEFFFVLRSLLVPTMDEQLHSQNFGGQMSRKDEKTFKVIPESRRRLAKQRY